VWLPGRNTQRTKEHTNAFNGLLLDAPSGGCDAVKLRCEPRVDAHAWPARGYVSHVLAQRRTEFSEEKRNNHGCGP
jgi:hypothetical protein